MSELMGPGDPDRYVTLDARPVGTSPVVVGSYRGLILALFVSIVGALGTAVAALTPLDLADLGWGTPVVVAAGRALEAWALDRRSGPQAGALGGAPAVGPGPPAS